MQTSMVASSTSALVAGDSAAARLSIASMTYIMSLVSVLGGKLLILYLTLYLYYHGYASGGHRGTREA